MDHIHSSSDETTEEHTTRQSRDPAVKKRWIGHGVAWVSAVAMLIGAGVINGDRSAGDAAHYAALETEYEQVESAEDRIMAAESGVAKLPDDVSFVRSLDAAQHAYKELTDRQNALLEATGEVSIEDTPEFDPDMPSYFNVDGNSDRYADEREEYRYTEAERLEIANEQRIETREQLLHSMQPYIAKSDRRGEQFSAQSDWAAALLDVVDDTVSLHKYSWNAMDTAQLMDSNGFIPVSWQLVDDDGEVLALITARMNDDAQAQDFAIYTAMGITDAKAALDDDDVEDEASDEDSSDESTQEDDA